MNSTQTEFSAVTEPIDRNFGLLRARLVTQGGEGSETLYICTGEMLQIRHNTIEQSKEGVCLPLQLASNKDGQDSSRKYFAIFIHEDKAYIVDRKSPESAMVDRRRLKEDVPFEITFRHRVKLHEKTELVVQKVSPSADSLYNMKILGATNDHLSPAVFIENPTGELRHAYALVPGKIRLTLDRKGLLRPRLSGNIEFFFANNSLWVSGEGVVRGTCRMLVDGMSLKIQGYTIRVSAI